MTDVPNSIRVVAKQTGLSPHVIRIWEKRYGAVTPTRTASKRRVYVLADIERLILLRHATRAGHSIGNVARLSDEQLRKLAGGAKPTAAAPEVFSPRPVPEQTVQDCLVTVRKLDSAGLETLLEQAGVNFGQHGMLQNVVGPLATAIGDQWRAGNLTAAHEHMASWTIRLVLGKNSKPFAMNGIAPTLVVGTPAGQLHEIGAVMAAAAAADVGWRVTYVGSSLPAADFAGVAMQNNARAVALSVVYPGDDPGLPNELQQLRRLLPAGIPIIVGGRAAPAYRDALSAIGALVCHDLNGLCSHLDQLRLTPVAAGQAEKR